MDAEWRELIREIRAIAPEIADWLEKMWNGGYSAAELKTLARALLDMARQGGGYLAGLVARALAILIRAGRVPGRAIGPLLDALFKSAAAEGGTIAGGTAAGVEGGAAAGGAGATGGAGGGAAAGGAMTVGAALFLLFALGFLTYRVYNELTAEIDPGDGGGKPCGVGKLGEAMALLPRELTTDSMWGGKASLQQAIDEAYADARRMSSNCTGGCGGGKKCQPTVAVMEVEQWSTFPYLSTYTRLVYTTPCMCL